MNSGVDCIAPRVPSNTVISVPIGAEIPSVERVMICSVIGKSRRFVKNHRPKPSLVGNRLQLGISSPSGNVPGVLAATVVGVGIVWAPAELHHKARIAIVITAARLIVSSLCHLAC
jgi:hypothetical protein